MSRKRLSVRRQNELAALDIDLPLIKIRTPSVRHVDENNDFAALDTDLPLIKIRTPSVQHVDENNLMDIDVNEEPSHSNCSGSDCSSPTFSSNMYLDISDDSCGQNTEISNFSLRQKLRKIAIEEGLTTETINKILAVLNPYHPELPLDARTLKGIRQHKISIRDMDNGRYCHLGLTNGILAMQSQLKLKTGPLELLFNIDGLPITKGGEKNFWPILCRVTNSNCSVFPVGIYEGKNKPKCFNTYLTEFVSETNEVVKNGIDINGRKYDVHIKGFIMDAPATASVLYVAPFNAYNGCRKCWAKGAHEGKIVFPELRSIPRTNAEFRNKNCSSHHNGTSELEKLDINMVDDIPLDPMHLLYLGVVKKLIGQWMERKRGSPEKLSLQAIAQINEQMVEYAKFYPIEFQRKPRRIDHYKMWKATEFRDFLLYFGPVALKGVMKASTFKHFMTLSTAARILSSSDYLVYNQAASDLLFYFVRNFKTLYGITQITYNVHGLLHLANDCAKFGPLESFSAFKFESYLGKLKQKVRSAYLPLPQICNRILEMRSLDSEDNNVAQKEIVFSRPVQNTNKFKQAEFKNFVINAEKNGQNCILMKSDQAVRVIEFIGEDTFIGEEVENIEEFHDKPRSLHELHNIFTANFSKNKCEYLTKNIAGKFTYLPLALERFYFVPLIHTTK